MNMTKLNKKLGHLSNEETVFIQNHVHERNSIQVIKCINIEYIKED